MREETQTPQRAPGTGFRDREEYTLQSVVTALAADYLNVYIIEPERDRGTIVKLEGYVINGITQTPRDFTYSQVLGRYADDRVCDEDRAEFLDMLLPEPLIRSFRDGRKRLELKYRVPTDGGLEHYSGMYLRISEPSEELKLIAGFRSTEAVISLQNKTRDEGLYSAYTAVSDLYLAMFRVDIANNTYTAIKTTDPILKYTAGGNADFDKDMKAVITGVAEPESVKPALRFLDRHTIEQRMRGRSHLALYFTGRIAGSCRLHLIREQPAGEDGRSHILLAVEMLGEKEPYIVLSKLREQYATLYYADFTTDYMHTYKTNESYGPKYGATEHYSVSMGAYVENDIAEEDRERMRRFTDPAYIMERFRTEEAIEAEFVDSSFGDTRYCTLRYIKANADGTCAVICGMDVTAQREEENRKKAELEIMRGIIEASGMGTWRIELADGKAPRMLADKCMMRILGLADRTDLTPEEIYDFWYSRIKPEALQSVLGSVERMKKTKDENTYLWMHPTLGERYVRCGGTAREIPGGYLLSGYHYDVDETVREQKKQDEEMRRQFAIIQSLSKGFQNVFAANLNDGTARIIRLADGYRVRAIRDVDGTTFSFDEAVDRWIRESVHPDDRQRIRDTLNIRSLRRLLAEREECVGNYRNIEDGVEHHYQYDFRRVDDEGNIVAGFRIIDDLVEAQIAQEKKDREHQEQLSQALMAAQQANRAKTLFLNSMSHDIRTPMNAIIGFTALAQAHLDQREQVQDYLSKISTSGTHLLSLINDILDMSRIESGTVKLDEKPVHIPDLLHDLRTMIQGLVNAKNLNLFIDTQDVVHEDVITDKLRLNQVLINIVSNAVKYTPSGGDIIVRLRELPSGRKHFTTYEFRVKDNGIGMSKEFIGHIFDTFSREQTATVSGIQGTGLGMAITKNIVDMMGGEIRVESEEGKGSLFTVTLNLRLSGEPVRTEPIPELQGARALVVDDDIETCRSVSKMLWDIQMRADWCVSGREAVIRAQDAAQMGDEYKVYIIDYLMPDMNGIETVRRIRRVIREDVPIIVLTAYDWGELEQEARQAGVSAFVSKPLFPSELRKVLAQPSAREGRGKETGGEAPHDYSGRRALLVEDNELNREIAAAILEETGLRIDTAEDGDAAVEVINREPADKYDLILMDIQMPKMDGYTATREIRTLSDNRKANIPIVAMTANAFEEDRQKAYEAGMNGHIIKPISLEEIEKVLDTIWKD